MLLENGADVQARNTDNGYVPLHEAAKAGHLRAVELLVQYKAAYMPRTVHGEFPVDFARENHYTEVVQFLGKQH